MSFLLPDSIPAEYQSKAEEVRAYLVQLRGGAPFLSAADARLLIQWLDQGISTAAILAALDQVSLNRKKKRVRSRLSLSVCRGSLKKVTTSNKKKVSAVAGNPIITLSTAISNLPISAALGDQRDALSVILMEIGEKKGDVDDSVISSAISACMEFHSAAWDLASDEHEDLQLQAEEELAPLATILPPIKWQESVEEIMRGTVRMRYPLISAKNIWDAINQTDPDS